MSLNGAKLLLNKGPPRKATIEDMSDAVAAPTIITPHALPMFRDSEIGRSTKRKREKERMDPRKSRRPELPVTGPGRGGRVGASATQHVVQNLVRDTTRDEDVRMVFVLLTPDWLSPCPRASSRTSYASFIVDISGYPSSVHPIGLSRRWSESSGRHRRRVGGTAHRAGCWGHWGTRYADWRTTAGSNQTHLAVAVVTRRMCVASRNRPGRPNLAQSPIVPSSRLPLSFHDVLLPLFACVLWDVLMLSYSQPREALLKLAATADENPVWTAGGCPKFHA